MSSVTCMWCLIESLCSTGAWVFDTCAQMFFGISLRTDINPIRAPPPINHQKMEKKQSFSRRRIRNQRPFSRKWSRRDKKWTKSLANYHLRNKLKSRNCLKASPSQSPRWMKSGKEGQKWVPCWWTSNLRNTLLVKNPCWSRLNAWIALKTVLTNLPEGRRAGPGLHSRCTGGAILLTVKSGTTEISSSRPSLSDLIQSSEIDGVEGPVGEPTGIHGETDPPRTPGAKRWSEEPPEPQDREGWEEP